MASHRLGKTLLAGALVGGLMAGSTSVAALPLPVTTAATVAGDALVDQVGWRHRHYGWRRDHGGGAFAAAALGIIGLAAAASANRYYYGGYPYHGYGYAPAYYAPPVYAYPRVRVVRVVRYYPSYSYYPHWGYRRAYYSHWGHRGWGHRHWGYRRAYWR